MRKLFPYLAAGALGLSAAAHAENLVVHDFSAEQLSLDPAAVDSLLLGSGHLLEPGQFNFTVAGHYEKDPLILTVNGKDKVTVIGDRVSVDVLAAYAPWKWLELGINAVAIPYQDGNGSATYGLADPSDSGIGAPSVYAKTAITRQEDGAPLSLAGKFGVDLPFGTSSAIASADVPIFSPELTASRHMGRFTLVLQAGVNLRESTMLANERVGNEAYAGASLTAKVSIVDLEVTTLADVPFYNSPVAWEALAGGRVHAGPVSFFALAGPGLSDAAGTPEFRVLAGMGWNPQFAKKGVITAQAPKATPAKEDVCAPGHVHAPGQCPLLDDDKDGIVNRDDFCPVTPGVASEHGCPVKDTDGDGIADADDACPTEKGLPELKGCPLKDQDKDGIADAEDNCPTEPGTAENHGCPADVKQLVVITNKSLVILDKVHFATGSARILSNSMPLLAQVASVLNSHQQIKKTVIEGHTDNSGRPASNRKLSQARAASVRQALMSFGVDPERMSSEGFGPDRPVADNTTPEGREQNRRVEFRIAETQDSQNPAVSSSQNPAGEQ